MDKVMEFIPFMLEGAVVTVELFALTLVISLPLGLPIALGSNSRIKPLSFICKVYVDFQRNTAATAAVLLLLLFPTGSQYTDECFYHGGSDICA